MELDDSMTGRFVFPWYVVHTKPRQGRRVLENLTRQGYRSYLPHLKKGLIKAGNFRRAKNKLQYAPLLSIQDGVIHRLENRGEDPVQLIEVQVGEYLEEDDIERFEDTYGRTAVEK